MLGIISEIRRRWPDCAVTLSIGELSYESYRKFFEAGADRYLLRHETYDASHYARLHPESLSARHRRKCLLDLKEIGYQTGTGFMVGSPYQTAENLADDMLFIKKTQSPDGRYRTFIPHHDTPFADQPAGTLELTLFLLGTHTPPAAEGSPSRHYGIDSEIARREKGILAGANVVMPNLSPEQVRKNYMLYDNKLCTGDEAAESLKNLDARFRRIGYHIAVSRGDSLNT